MCNKRAGAGLRKVIDKVIDWPHLEKRRIMSWLLSLPRIGKGFARHRIVHVESEFMLDDVLKEFGARPLPGYPSLDEISLFPRDKIGDVRYRRPDPDEDPMKISPGNPMMLRIADAPMVFFRSRFFNFEGIGTLRFLVYADEAQILAFTDAYNGAARKLMLRRDRMFDLVTGRFVPRPQTKMEDVILRPGISEDILANTLGLFKMGDQYRRLGIPWRRGVILAGPPGNGKTMFLKALANACHLPFCLFRIEEETKDASVRGMFRAAAKFAPCVLVVEDLDRVQEAHLNLSTFLNGMDGLEEADGLLTIATTNRPEMIDPALLSRPARFDRKYVFGLPRPQERKILLERLGSGRFGAGAIKNANERMDGFSMAGVRETIISALYFAAAEGKEPGDSDLAKAVEKMRREVRRSKTAMAEDAGAAGFGNGSEEDDEPFIVQAPGGEGPEWR